MVNGDGVVGRGQGSQIAGADSRPPSSPRPAGAIRTEFDPPRDECGYRDLVGPHCRPWWRRGRSAARDRPAEAPENRLKSGASKVSWPNLGEIEPGGRPLDAIRATPGNGAIGVRMSGGAQLSDHRTIGKFDHAMDDRLRMHRGRRSHPASARTDRRPRSPRAPCSSSDAEIDGDLLPHAPVRMFQRLRQRRLLDIGDRPGAETVRPMR